MAFLPILQDADKLPHLVAEQLMCQLLREKEFHLDKNCRVLHENNKVRGFRAFLVPDFL